MDFFDDEHSDEVLWIDDSQDAISIGFIEYFKLLLTPNSANKTSHSLLEIIFTSVCAYICGANSWDGVYEFAKTREVWLRKFIPLINDIPFTMSGSENFIIVCSTV